MRILVGLIERLCRDAAHPLPCRLTDARSLAEALAHARREGGRG